MALCLSGKSSRPIGLDQAGIDSAQLLDALVALLEVILKRGNFDTAKARNTGLLALGACRKAGSRADTRHGV
jgi:hypothetical protein